MVSEHYLCSYWIHGTGIFFTTCNIYHENSTIPLGNPMGKPPFFLDKKSPTRKPWAFRRMFRMDSADAWVAKAANGQLPCYETTALPWAPFPENVRKRTAAWCTVMRCLARESGRWMCPLEMWVESVNVAVPLDAIALSMFRYF